MEVKRHNAFSNTVNQAVLRLLLSDFNALGIHFSCISISAETLERSSAQWPAPLDYQHHVRFAKANRPQWKVSINIIKALKFYFPRAYRLMVLPSIATQLLSFRDVLIYGVQNFITTTTTVGMVFSLRKSTRVMVCAPTHFENFADAKPG